MQIELPFSTRYPPVIAARVKASFDDPKVLLRIMAAESLQKSTNSRCNDPASRAAVDQRGIITEISSQSTCFDREVVKGYASLCKAAMKESILKLAEYKDAVYQCQSAAEETAHNRDRLRRQLIENILSRDYYHNEEIIQQILKSGQTNKELNELRVKFSSTKRQWQAKHMLNKLLA